MKSVVIAISLGVVVAGCTNQRPDRVYLDVPPPPVRDLAFVSSAEGQEIAELAFRHQMANPGEYATADAYYLAICDRDPSKAFLSRFESEVIPVLAASAFQAGGIGLHVANIRKLAHATVEVDVSVHQASVSGVGLIFVMKKQSGRWSVVDTRKKWVS